MRFTNKVVIITGASSGIGRATALQFAQENAQVVVADVNDEGGQETVAMIRNNGHEATYCHADVSVASDVQGMVHTAVETYGRLDVLHNNAFWNQAGTMVELEEDGWDRTLDVCLKALYLGCKYAIPEMLKTGGGVIVNTASVHSIVSFNRYAAYDAAKAGVLGLTKSVALDFGPQIRCNAVLPGAIYPTGAWAGVPAEAAEAFARGVPMKRLGHPDDIARAVAFLASDDASFITGAALVVDGGLTIIGMPPEG
jgi:NAD(P)-dependent dehydrogenase (short-subunit alcohol dehydrogenase family)